MIMIDHLTRNLLFCTPLCDSDKVQHNLGRDLTRAEHQLTADGDVDFSYDVVRSTAVQLGPMLIRSGLTAGAGPMQRVIMHRKGSGVWAVPRFGLFLGVLLHQGPDKVQRMMLLVKWFKTSPVMYHRVMRTPTAMVAVDTTLPTLCLAEDIVPFVCFAAPDLGDTARLVILSAKNWSCLPLLGFPRIP